MFNRGPEKIQDKEVTENRKKSFFKRGPAPYKRQQMRQGKDEERRDRGKT